MKFKDFKYERISYETIEKQFSELLEALKKRKMLKHLELFLIK